MATDHTKAPLGLMLQCCPRDALDAEALVNVLAAIESKPRTDVEFILAIRRDTDPDQAKAICNAARQAYGNAQIIESRRYGIGWPQGCNDLWQDCMMQAGEMKLWGGLKCNGILTFEPDCQPLRPDWIDALKAAWVEALIEGKLCLGYRYPDGSELPHINGNMVVVPEILRINPKMCMSYKAWDTEHRAYLMEVGKHTPLIEQRYQQDAGITDYKAYVRKIMRLPHRPALLHGLKSASALIAVREMIEGGEFWNIPEEMPCEVS